MLTIRLADTQAAEAVSRACEIIRSGGIVAFPTETFYALGVRFDDHSALARLYELKQRPYEKALPLIAGDIARLLKAASSIDPAAEKLINRFWPGPLTILFPALPSVSDYITGGTGRVAIRVPGKSFALDLAQSLSLPLTATSANISGRAPAGTASDITGYFGDSIDLMIDGGATPGGLPSTIVDVSGPAVKVLREGAISTEEILRTISL